MKTLKVFSLILTALFATSACISAGPTPPGSATPQTSPTLSPQSTQQPALPAEAPQTFVVLASRGWDTTGIYIRPGQSLEVAAFGSWRIGSDGDSYGPNGMGGEDNYSSDFILPSAPAGALIGRIGKNAPFEIGDHIFMTADFGGEIQLSINDHPEAMGDNAGTLEVSVVLGPLPVPPTQLLTNYYGEYILLYPAGYHAMIYEGGLCLTQAEAMVLACHVANAFIEISDARGRTLDQIASEIASQANPDIEVRRTSLMVSGEEAVLLDNIYTYDVLRKVVILHNDRTYVLTFVPWTDVVEDFSRLENLYNTVIRSFNFLPQPETSTPAEAEALSHISAVSPVTVYSGPGRQHPVVGVLQVGSTTQLLGELEGDYWPDRWVHIACPEGIADGCWVLWDMNALYSYEGPPVALDIPNPAMLAVESTRTFASPDARWQVKSTESEVVSFGPDDARFFFVEFTVTSLVDGISWRSVSEWHAYGLGLETAPQPFHWSRDGRYLYYTSLVIPDGGCGYYANSGESVDRLDLSDGSVSTLQPPYNRWMLAISPDESRMAYLSYIDGYQLIVRDLAAAYFGEAVRENSIQRQIPLDIVPPEVVSQIAWSPDGQKVLVTVTEIAINCQPAQDTEWTLDLATGELVEGTTTIYPTPTP